MIKVKNIVFFAIWFIIHTTKESYTDKNGTFKSKQIKASQMFSFCSETFCIKYNGSMLSELKLLKYLVSNKITFYLLNVVNLNSVVQFIRIISFFYDFQRNANFNNILLHEMSRPTEKRLKFFVM